MRLNLVASISRIVVLNCDRERRERKKGVGDGAGLLIISILWSFFGWIALDGCWEFGKQCTGWLTARLFICFSPSFSSSSSSSSVSCFDGQFFFLWFFFLSLTLSLSLYLFHNGENELLFFASFFNDIQRTGASASERGWFLLHFNYGNTWWSGWSQFHRQQLIRARSVCDAAQKKRIQGINSRQLHVWYLKARRIWTSRNCKL